MSASTEKTQPRVTPRMLEALAIVAEHPALTPRGLAFYLWPDKQWKTGRYNAASLHGAKMLWRLRDAGLVHFRWNEHLIHLYEAHITPEGERLLAERA